MGQHFGYTGPGIKLCRMFFDNSNNARLRLLGINRSVRKLFACSDLRMHGEGILGHF